MIRTFKPLSFIASTFLALFLSTGAWASLPQKTQAAFVAEVLSGDTVRLKGGKTLKYTGLQAPPLQSVVPLTREYGANALAFNQNLVDGKKILIEWGPQLRDAQNNLLGYVFLEDGTSVNRQLLLSGNAKAQIVTPNTKYSADFRAAELDAMRQKRGLWLKEAVNPYIKNEYIGEKNTKIFYFPTSPELDRIPEAHLTYFRSRVEAVAAGYKPCATCREKSKELFA